jgi:WD40 repeat protein
MSDSGGPDGTNQTPSEATGQVVVPFPSLPALHSAHLELIRRQRESATTPELNADADDFIQRGSATGVLLDADADRETAQGLLDYWATILYRTGYEPPDATLAEFDAELAPELDDALCPYVGLDSFRESDNRVFFGRQHLIQELVEQLKSHRLLVVIGPSGSGKSSVVRAGLIPALHADALPDSGSWRDYPPMVPGADPLRSLARILRPTGAGADWIAEQVALFKQDSTHLARLIADSGANTAVLMIDQFEEIFTLTEEEAARRAFIDNVLHLIDLASAEHTVIMTMRSDFEPFVARVPELQMRFAEGRVPVTPLSAAELRDAIEKPAALVGLKFEAGVVEALLHDLLGEPAALPLLQFTLLKLWENRQRNRVTIEAYKRLGGGRLALSRSADELYAALIPEEQVTARRVLLRMVRPGDGLEVTSHRIRRVSLYQIGEANDRIDRVVEKLIQARLVRMTGGDTPEEEQIEVAHEALVRNWPTLVGWLEDERAALAARRRLEAKATEWVRLGRGSSGLLDREQLLDAEHWLASPEAADLGFDPSLPELVVWSRAAIEEAELEQEAARQRELHQAQALAESERQRAEAERKRAELEEASNRRLKWLFRALAVLTMLAFGLALWATSAQVRVSSALSLANDANATVAAQNSTLQTAVIERGVAVAQAQTSVQEAANNLATAVAAQSAVAIEQQKAARQQHEDRANLLAAVSHAVSESKPQLSLLLGVESLRATQAFGEPPTGAATRTLTETLIGIGAPSLGLFGHTGRVTVVAISADGSRMLSGSTDGSVRLWDLSAANPVANPISLPGTTAPIDAVAFSADGSRLIAAGDDGAIHIWGTTNQATPRDIQGPRGPISNLLVSPDGRWLAVTGNDPTAYIWRLDNLDAAPITLAQHSGVVNDLAISGDSRLILTVGADGLAFLWDLTARTPGSPSSNLIARPRQPTLTAAALSPNGRVAVTAAQDGALHIWTVSGNRFFSGPTVLNTGNIAVLAIDPLNRWIVTGGTDGTVRLWPLAGRGAQFILAGHTGPITALAFSADGSRLVTASADNTARVWALNESNPAVAPRVLRGHEGKLNGAALSLDGSRLATGSDDTSARAWDLAAPPPSTDSLPQDPAALTTLACTTAGRNLDEATEWRLYFEGKSYEATCGG